MERMASKPTIEPRELRRHLEVIGRTGKMILGFRQSYLSILHRKSKLVIIASNCPPSMEKEIRIACAMSGTPYIKVGVPGRELGFMAGKPFSASVISIIDPGASSLLEQAAPSEEEE